jgi:hypothetical protein
VQNRSFESGLGTQVLGFAGDLLQKWPALSRPPTTHLVRISDPARHFPALQVTIGRRVLGQHLKADRCELISPPKCAEPSLCR